MVTCLALWLSYLFETDDKQIIVSLLHVHSLRICYLHRWRLSRLLWLTDAGGAGNSGHAMQQGTAMQRELDWAKHPHVHEIRMSTSDSHCWAVTVKQIISVGGVCHIPLRHGYLLNMGQTGVIMALHWNLFHHITWVDYGKYFICTYLLSLKKT